MSSTDAAGFPVSPCLKTAYTLQFYSLIFSKYCFVLGSLFLYPLPEESLYMWFQTLDCTTYKSLVYTLVLQTLGTNKKTLFCPKKNFLLKYRYWRDDSHIFSGTPFGLGGEEGWSRAERSQLSFKTCTAFKFPCWLSALVGMSHHIFWASLCYVTQRDRDNLCDKSQKPVCQWGNRKLTVFWRVP